MSGEAFFKPTPRHARLEGKQIPGGCEDCGAFQTLEADSLGIYVLRIHHDDTCPAYRSMRQERES